MIGPDELRGRLFVTVSEAAQVLLCDERTVRRAIEAGDIPAVKVSGVTRIRAAALLTMAGIEAAAEETPVRPTPLPSRTRSSGPDGPRAA